MGCGASVGYESTLDPREDKLKYSPVAATLGAGVGFGGDVCCGQQSCCSSSSRRRVPWGWPGSGIRTQALPLLELFQTTAGCHPQVTHEGQWLLKELPAPVRVIALIGQSRAGKSATCSALARQECEASTSEVLTVGHDLHPVTKGACAVAVLCPKGSGTVLYIDCEGTDHPLADNLEHSSLAAAVSLGVASQLICCDHGYIRETSLETLADIVAAYRLMCKGPVVRRPDLCMLTVNSRFSAQDPEIEAGFKAELSSQDDRASTRATIASAFGEIFVRSLPHLDDISYGGALNDLRCELLHRADEVEATGFDDLEERSGEDVLLELQQLCVQAVQGHDALRADGDETFGNIVSPRSEGSSAALQSDGTLNSTRSRSRSTLLKSHPLRVQVESGAQRAVIFNSCPLREQVPRLCEALGKRYDSHNDKYVLTRTVGSNVFVMRNTSQLFTFPKGTELMLERGTDVLQKALSAVATAPKSLRPERLLQLNSILRLEAFFVDEAIDRNAIHIVMEAAKSSPGSTEPAMACLGALLQSSNALDWLKDHTWEIDSKLLSRIFEVLFASEAPRCGIKTSQGTRPWASLTTSLYLLEALPELSVAAAHQAGQEHGKVEAYAAMMNSIESPEAPEIEANAGLLLACSMVDAADRLGDDALHDEILHDMLEQVDGQNHIAALFEKKHRKQRFTEELLTAFMGLNSELYGGQTSAEIDMFEQEIEALNAKLKKTQDINESLKTELRQRPNPGCVTPGPKDTGAPRDTGTAGLRLDVGGPLTAQMIENCLPQLVEDGKVALQRLSDQSCSSDVVSTLQDPDLIRRVVSGVGARVLLGSMSSEDHGTVSEKPTPASTRHGQSTHATTSQSSSSQDLSRESSFSLMDEEVLVEFPHQIGSMALQQSEEQCTALAALTSLSNDPFRDAPETQDSICRMSSSDLSLPPVPCGKARGKGTAPGPPPPRARLQPTQGSSEGKNLLAREGKGKGKGIPPAPVEPTRKPVFPKVPLKSLQWTRYLFGHHLREGQTIWDLVPDYAGVVPADEMERKFARSKSSARAPLNPIIEEPRVDRRDSELRLIEEAKERMPYEIASMQMPPAEELVHAIEELDEDMLPLEMCREVAKWLCPDGKRLEALKRKRTDNPNVPWAMPEHYMWTLGHLPACAQRLECWQFLRAFDEEHMVYTESVAQFECVVDGFMRSQSIAPMLGYVLAFGNFLNGGTRLGQADGFNMDALNSLEAVKDQESKDVRHVIFDTFFQKHEDKAQQFIDDLAPCLQNVGRSYVGSEVLKSVKSSIEGLTALVEKIKDGSAQCRSHMDQVLALIEDPADLFKLQMPPKLKRTQEAIDQLVDRTNQAHRAYRQMLSWYRAGDMISADWCLLWDDFLVPKHLISNRETALRKEVLIPRFCKGRPLDLESLRLLWQLKELDSVQKKASSIVSRPVTFRRARSRRTLLLLP